MYPNTIQEEFGIEDGPVRKTGKLVSSLDSVVTHHSENKHKSQLASIIHKAIQSEIFVRLQKNLILVKALADSLERGGWFAESSHPDQEKNEMTLSERERAAIGQAIQQIRASERRISAIFSPIVFQLYPERVEAITLYMADVTMACVGERSNLPISLLNDIQIPKVQYEILEEPDKKTQSKQDLNSEIDLTKDKVSTPNLQSREYFLFLASIYLSETVEQLEKTFIDEMEVKRLTRLIRPEISSVEGACSKMYKMYSKRLAKQSKWRWSSDFRTL